MVEGRLDYRRVAAYFSCCIVLISFKNERERDAQAMWEETVPSG